MTIDRKTVITFVAAFALCWVWTHHQTPAPSPWQPKDRPVLRFIARAAKSLLWVALIAEPPPPATYDRQLVHAPPVGEDGHPIIDNGRSF